MWSQLSQFTQLSQSTTIVATPTTSVAKNHNCRNANRNCRNLINHNCHNANHNCRNKLFWSFKHLYMVKGWCFLRLFWLLPYFLQYCFYFALLNCKIYPRSTQFECWDQIWLYFLCFTTMFAVTIHSETENLRKMKFVDKLTIVPKFCDWTWHVLLFLLIYQNV